MRKRNNNKDMTEQQVERNNKLSPPRKHDTDQENDHNKFPLESSNDQDTQVKQKMSEQQQKKKKISRRRFYSFGWSEMSKLSNWRQPSYYLPAVIVLILLFLVFFGRSFAILCTSIGWYIVPTLQSKSASSSNNRSSKSSSSNQNVTKKPAVRKEYLRTDIDTKMAAGHKTAAAANHHHHQSETTPKKHGHKKSC